GENLMYALRLRVFSHFQRLSLDFFTDEKAGRLMTRMTSDIEALSVLFQDGLVNLAVQGLTLLVITIVMVTLNPTLALVTVLLVGGRMVLHHSLTIGELTAFMLYLTSFFAPIQQLVQLYNTYQQGQAAVGKLRDLLRTPPSVREAPGAAELPPIAGDIVFEGVS